MHCDQPVPLVPSLRASVIASEPMMDAVARHVLQISDVFLAFVPFDHQP